MDQTNDAYVFTSDGGEVRWMGKTSTRFLATGTLTQGAFGLVEERVERGVSVPLHRHADDPESFYVIEGEITFFLGDRPTLRADAGSFVHIPAGVVHGFRVTSETGRYLILTTPRHAEFYRAITLPSPGASVDGSVVGRACAAFGVEFVGPLPG